ncbi:MAG: anti-sigma factor family protein [Nitriliruptoraceae bacterium]
MISCAQAVQQLWEYLEDEVSSRDRQAVEEHLAFCRRCCGEVEFAEELRSVLEEASEVELPTAVERRLVGVLDELDDEAVIGTEEGPGGERA